MNLHIFFSSMVLAIVLTWTYLPRRMRVNRLTLSLLKCSVLACLAVPIVPGLARANTISVAQAQSCLRSIRKDGMSEDAVAALHRKLPYFFKHVRNTQGMILIDYSQHAYKDRMFLLDFARCKVVYKTPVVHGGAWYIFYDQNGNVLPNSKGHHRYDRFSPGDPEPTDYLKTCINPNTGNRQHMTRPGFVRTSGCHTTALDGWPILWSSGKRACHGIRLAPLEKKKQGSLAGVVIHEHERLRDSTVGQGCPGTKPGRVSGMIHAGLSHGYDIRTNTLVYIYAPTCGE